MRVTMGLGVCAVLLCGVMGASAQMESPQGSTAGAASVAPAKAFDSLLSLFEGEAMGVAKAMPAEKYNFAPSAAIFKDGSSVKYDGVRTFAQEVIHLTQANYSFYSTVGGTKPDVDVKGLSSLKDKDAIVAALQASFDYGHKAMATLTTEDAFQGVKGPGVQTRATMAAFGIAHGFDHYGQMVEYLRMNGIVPPGSK